MSTIGYSGPVLVQRVYMTHLGGSIWRCFRPIALYKLNGLRQGMGTPSFRQNVAISSGSTARCSARALSVFL